MLMQTPYPTIFYLWKQGAIDLQMFLAIQRVLQANMKSLSQIEPLTSRHSAKRYQKIKHHSPPTASWHSKWDDIRIPIVAEFTAFWVRRNAGGIINKSPAFTQPVANVQIPRSCGSSTDISSKLLTASCRCTWKPLANQN